MKKILLALCALMLCVMARAEELTSSEINEDTVPAKAEKEQQPIQIKFELRMDWEGATVLKGLDKTTAENFESGIGGKYLDFHLNGYITDGLSYHYRQRLNKANVIFDSEGAGKNWFFNSIDKAFFTYEFNPRWSISAGKAPLVFGGWEYDAPPIDLYMTSQYWNNIYCFQFMARGQYNTKDGKNSIIAEVGNSIFTPEGKMFGGLYSYSLLWYGRYDVFNSAYSVNIEEYERGKMLYHVISGNQFKAGPMTIEADLIWRYAGKGKAFDDFSVVGKVIGNCNGWANVFGKVGYERNFSNDFNYTVAYGKQSIYYGVGAEVFPVKKKDVFRVHAFLKNYVMCGQGEKFAESVDNRLQFGVGATVRLVAFERK